MQTPDRCSYLVWIDHRTVSEAWRTGSGRVLCSPKFISTLSFYWRRACSSRARASRRRTLGEARYQRVLTTLGKATRVTGTRTRIDGFLE
jgi:hypothetical protein